MKSHLPPAKARPYTSYFSPYIRSFLLGAFAVLAFFLSVTWLVDPYGLGSGPIWVGINDKKLHQREFGRLVKPLMSLYQSYNGFVLGASREERGIDTTDPKLISAGYHFFNFAISEERPYEMDGIFRFLTMSQNVQTLIVPFDFTRYNHDPAAANDTRMYYPKSWNVWPFAQYVRLILSNNALRDSYDTLFSRSDTQFYGPDGRLRIPGEPPKSDYPYLSRFQEVFDVYLNSFFSYHVQRASEWRQKGFDHTPLKRMLARAANYRTHLIVVLEPDHALESEALRYRGLWPLVEKWKKEITCTVTEARHQYPDLRVELWDFGGYNKVTTQRLLTAGTREKAMDYWDPVHYTIEIGQHIMARVLDLPILQNEYFGTQITDKNIRAYLEGDRRAREDYVAAHSEELAWLTNVAKPNIPSALVLPEGPESFSCDILPTER